MKIDGKYFNGINPISINVSCNITADGLSIVKSDTEELVALWNMKDIFHDENQNTAFVIGHRLDRSKIEIFNLEIASKLGLTNQTKNIVSKDLKSILKWIGLIVIIGLVYWFSIPVLSKIVASKIPFEYEVRAAEKMKFNDFFKPCHMDAKQTKALSTFANFLYPKNKAEKNMPVNFFVSKNSMINAFTLPGGKIVLFSGLLKETKSPEELLGVMGHELGHVVARDSAGLLVRGSLLGTFFGFLTGDFSTTFAVSPQILLSTAALTFDRDMERDADLYAVSRLNLLNVSTSGIRAFFSRRIQDDFNPPEILMTHPDYKARFTMIKATYPKKPLPKEIEDAWMVIKSVCD